MSLEKKLWADLKKETANKVHWTRLEAWVGVGIPDLNGVAPSPTRGPANGIEFWLELKVCRTQSLTFYNLWRPAQIAWQTLRSRQTSNVFNLVRHPESKSLYIYGAHKIPEITKVNGPCTVDPDFTVSGPMSCAKCIEYIVSSLDGR